MSRLLYDLHTHTTLSHGKGSVDDNVKVALERGLERIAITDHGTWHVSYGVRNIKQYIDKIEEVKKKYAGKIQVLLGMELNLCSLDGRADDIFEYENAFDILILGYHKFARMWNAKSYFYYYLTAKRDIIRNTDAVIAALERNNLSILTHPGYAMPVDIKEVARACARTDTLFEINEKHTDLTPEDIQLAASQGAKFILSSDAHTPQNVGNVRSAMEKFLAAGIPLELAVNLGE